MSFNISTGETGDVRRARPLDRPFAIDAPTLLSQRGPAREISLREAYALAVFSILEGSPRLKNTHEQLKVAAVVVNRLNSPNWSREFGENIHGQLFGKGQFAVIGHYGLTRDNLSTMDKAAATLARAKKIPAGEARELIREFLIAAQDPARYGAAAQEIGDATGFRSNGRGQNVFRKESRTDAVNVGSRQPTAFEIRQDTVLR